MAIFQDNLANMMSGTSFSVIAAPLFSFVVAFCTVLWLAKGNSPKILDYPNARSLHTHPIPRTGGVGLMSGILLAWILFSFELPVSVWVGLSLLIIISIADDIFDLPIWSRLLIHGVVAVWCAIYFLSNMHNWMTVLLIAVAIIWMSNLYNFMDGSDGLAGGMALIGFGCYGLVALQAGRVEFAMINFCVAAAALAFLFHNFYPARIFLGDVGAIPLGFLAAVLGVMGWIEGLWALCFPLVIFSPFITDATITLIKRSLRGEKIWLAHREHYYQRLVQSGFGHRNTALCSYALMLVVGVTAVWAVKQSIDVQYWIGAMWGGIYLITMFVSEWFQKQRASRG